MKLVAINKHCRKLKDLSVEMPNAPYSNRCQQAEMNELLELNRKFLTKSYLWMSGILTSGFSIFLYFFHSEITVNWIFIIYSLTLIVLPLFVLSAWISDWFRKRKYKEQILNNKPYSELKNIGFTRKTIKPNHNSLIDYVQFAKINDCELIFDIDIMNPKIAEFQIYGYTNLNNSEFTEKFKELKSNNIDISYFGFSKMINTKKEKFNSIQELEQTLREFTHIVKKIKYDPIPIKEWKKI
ncbi:hypothetical protein [Lutibacter maritimus]|uniref:Uncharacterized protein n=1 Tax=Lutibacter maritimus TaxID=593133 RepID=A0A1I6SWR7_9FLAO|nr:hypothetical protein [Lutibacter maritimus]SFS81386.1 hypothetical protein SAMN04488006_0176 [Lutibacter maritimus]